MLNDFMFSSMDSLFGAAAPLPPELLGPYHHDNLLMEPPSSMPVSALASNPNKPDGALPPVPPPRTVKMSRKINRCLSNDEFQIVDAVEQYLIHNRPRAGEEVGDDPRRPVVNSSSYQSGITITMPPQYRNPHVFGGGESMLVDWEYELRAGDNHSDSD